ncbi:MAG: ABC transporter ATP-binding protein [Myxococcota bacterium]
MADIVFDDISHSYAEAPGRGGGAVPESSYVLRHLDAAFDDGKAYALLGPSGCGKTTMLNIISGLITPTEGRVRYDSRDVTKLPTRDRNIAQVFQFPVIYDTMTVFGNLAFPLRTRKRKAADIAERVGRIAELLDLGAVLRRRAANLTPDLKQIISLGRGLVRDDVAAILLDEPLTVIDPQRKWQIRRKLRQVHEEFGMTSIYVTHDQTEALTFADQVLVMNQGEIVQRGTPEELFARPAHTFVGYFIGTPGMNILSCELDGDGARVAGHPMPLSAAQRAQVDAEAGELELGIRPEFVRLSDTEDSTETALPVTVTAVEDHGRFSIASAELGDAAIKIKYHGGPALRAGDRARVHFPAEHTHLYRDGRIVASDEDRAS